jgi:hypothetical protein
MRSAGALLMCEFNAWVAPAASRASGADEIDLRA